MDCRFHPCARYNETFGIGESAQGAIYCAKDQSRERITRSPRAILPSTGVVLDDCECITRSESEIPLPGRMGGAKSIVLHAMAEK
jgi:hypothetical protein